MKTRSDKIDLTGKVFTNLTVIRDAPSKNGNSYWVCICRCSPEKERIVQGDNLKNGGTKSCGCYRLKHGATIRGEKRPRSYVSWADMKARCKYPSNENYERYGGRGITVCERWIDSYENFLEDMGEPTKGLTLERKNNDGNYSPENCKWATDIEQVRNRRSNHNLTYNGETKCLVEWSEILNINYNTLKTRINQAGWSVEQAFETPVKGKNYVKQI